MLAPFEGINIHALGPILQAYQARKQIEAGQPLRDAQTNYYNSTADYNRSTRSTPRTSEVVQGQMVQLAQMMSRFEQEAANAEAQGDKARAQQIRMQKLPYQSLFDSYAKIGHGDPRALDINALVNRRLIQEQ